MLAGIQAINNADAIQQQDSGLYMGFATSTSTSNNIVLVGNSDDASSTMDTDGYNYTGQCLAMIVIGGGNPSARASLSAFGANAFTLNWLERTTTNRRSIYMAIKGGLWNAGSTTIAGNSINARTTISGFPYRIRGGCFMGAMKTQSTQDTSTTQDRISYGSFRKGIGAEIGADTDYYCLYITNTDFNSLANSDTVIGYGETGTLAYLDNTASIITRYDIFSAGGNSVTIENVLAGGVDSEWIGYLIFGDNTNMTSVGHPFIM